MSTSDWAQEVRDKDRFRFGENWTRFLRKLDDEKIERATATLSQMLGVTSLSGKTFVDVGSGSGLSSLAARRLGATVHSFDFDKDSFACTRQLRETYDGGESDDWKVSEGSVLDDDFIKNLGTFDVVYSWGVLHHTGSMWKAIENAERLAKDNSTVFIAIYNDQGPTSNLWLQIKKFYNRLPVFLRPILTWILMLRLWGPTVLKDSLKGNPLRSWRNYSETNARGMTPYRDVVDWVGGLPFEVAKPEEIFHFFHRRGYNLENMVTCAGGIGCNEFVFHKQTSGQ